MPRIPKDRTRYMGGTLRPHGDKWDAYVRLNGKDHRARLPTEARAKAWIISVTSDPTRPLAPHQLADAAAALLLLPPGKTLVDAARALSGASTPDNDMRVKEAVSAYLGAREGFIRDRTMQGYRSTLNRFAVHTGGMMSGLAPSNVECFLRGCAPGTRNTRLRHLSAFFSWAVEHGKLGRAPLDTIRAAPKHDAEIHVLTPEQAADLMRHAVDYRREMAPYFALALFAGIRPDEIKKLPPAKIGREYITIDGAIAKKKRRRTIPIQSNLRAWLDAYPPKGRVIFYSRRAFNKIRDKLGFWKGDICRHSFGTYLFEMTKDTPGITAMMGNSARVFEDAYRALAAPGSGKKYFSIRP